MVFSYGFLGKQRPSGRVDKWKKAGLGNALLSYLMNQPSIYSDFFVMQDNIILLLFKPLLVEVSVIAETS